MTLDDLRAQLDRLITALQARERIAEDVIATRDAPRYIDEESLRRQPFDDETASRLRAHVYEVQRSAQRWYAECERLRKNEQAWDAARAEWGPVWESPDDDDDDNDDEWEGLP